VAGSSAGMLSVLANHPLDVVKMRLQGTRVLYTSHLSIGPGGVVRASNATTQWPDDARTTAVVCVRRRTHGACGGGLELKGSGGGVLRQCKTAITPAHRYTAALSTR
jgi:hypothetical protein